MAHPKSNDPKLDPNAILIAEFEYIAQTAFQANEDRARVSNYYFVTAAAAVAAIITVVVEATIPLSVYFGLAALFAILGLVGLLTVLQLARLRSAWTDSVRAMNTIKEYYQEHHPDARLTEAFAWTRKTIPPVNKPASMASLLSLSVILVDSLMMGTAVAYFSLALGADLFSLSWLVAALTIALIFAAVQYYLFLRVLGDT